MQCKRLIKLRYPRSDKLPQIVTVDHLTEICTMRDAVDPSLRKMFSDQRCEQKEVMTDDQIRIQI